MRLTRLLTSGILTALAATLVVPALTAGASTDASSKPTIVIGSTNFEEQAIVSNIWADVLTKAGYNVTVKPALGTRAIVVPAIEKGQINLEPDYAASLLGFLHGGNPQAAGDNITTAIPADQKALAKYGVTVLPASKALDTNVFAVTKATASKDHLTTISSLKPYASKLTLGGPPECPTFAGCEPGLKKTYGLTFAGFKSLDEAGPLSVAALKNGEVQVVELFSSDGNVVSNNFVALTDNKHLEGADYIVPVIRKSVNTAGVAEGAEQHRRQADHGGHLEAEPRRHVAAGAARRSGTDLGELGQRLIRRRRPTADRRPPTADRRPPPSGVCRAPWRRGQRRGRDVHRRGLRAPVDFEHLPGDPRRGVGDQVEHRTRDVLGLTRPAHRRAVQELLTQGVVGQHDVE